MKYFLYLTAFLIFHGCSGGDAMSKLAEKTETTVITDDTSIDTTEPVVNISLEPIEITSETYTPATSTSFTYSFVQGPDGKVRPKIVTFDLSGDSIVHFKLKGSPTNEYNTFYVRNKEIITTSRSSFIEIKMELQYYPGIVSALPQHDKIQIIPVTLKFDSHYSPMTLKIQGSEYYAQLPAKAAEPYEAGNYEVRLGKRKIDMSPKKANHNQHLVQLDDTIYSISRKYDITITSLIRLNPGLTAESTLFIGEKLYIR